MTATFRIGTRGSPLAIAQTEIVASTLRARHPKISFGIVPIRTHSDEGNPKDLGMGLDSKRAFTKRIEDALLDGRIDAAVHSLKDLPAELGQGLLLGAVPTRTQPWDALISRNGQTLERLPRRAQIGTSSLRRRSQLLAFRDTFVVEELRGNIGTRLRKLDEGVLDAIVLAAAGLERLGLQDRISQLLPVDVMTPAIGQGALAVEVRRDDGDALAVVEGIDDPKTRAETDAERGVARALGGGCNVPMGAFAMANGQTILLHAMIGSPDGRLVVRAKETGPSPAEVADRVVRQLRAAGGERLLLERDLP